MADTNKKICPGCAHEVEVGAEYCPQCGTLMTDANKKFCSVCYRLIDADAEYCPRCGAHLGTDDVKKKFCPACGQEVDVAAQYCPRCGARLSSPEEPNVYQNTVAKDELEGEAVVGWATGVIFGDTMGRANHVMFFTTDRFMVEYRPGLDDEMLDYVHKLLTERKKHETAYDAERKTLSIPYSAITQLQVKLPNVIHRGLVTVTTAQGEWAFRILWSPTQIKLSSSSRAGIPYLNPYPAAWEFLKSPPPKLEGKLVVEGSLRYVR